jgi:hypothetical protein
MELCNYTSSVYGVEAQIFLEIIAGLGPIEADGFRKGQYVSGVDELPIYSRSFC